MKRHMSNHKITGAQDIVNDLPVAIISRILKCLSLYDSAKLCHISRNWFDAWKGLPELRFDANFFADVLKSKTPDDFYKILSVILLSHVGFITEFYLDIPKLKSSKALDIGPWISFLSRNNIKDITIKNFHSPPLKLSYHLFSCLNLEKLTLENCVLNLLPFFKVLRNLKIIELKRVILMGNSFTDFIARCPVLQNLTLKQCQGFDSINIIAPNLKYLTIYGKFEFVYLRSANNLIDVSIVLEEMVPNYQNARTCELIARLVHPCRIENLSFGGHFCKFLTAGKTGAMFPTYFCCLKSLKLSNIETNDRDEFLFVSGIIRSCPVLEALEISFSSKDSAEHKVYSDPRYQMSRLRKVHLSSVLGVIMELKLIEFLLRSSPALEMMCIKRDAAITNDLESRLTRSLISYRRASPEATVVYGEP